MRIASASLPTGFQLASINALDVEARLIEAMRVFEDMSRSGRVWATDGPWYLSRLTNVEAYVRDLEHLKMGEAMDRVVRHPRPDRDMITRAEEAAGWLMHVDERDRRMVMLAVRCLALGHSRVPWQRLLRPLGLVRGYDGLRKRYAKALVQIERTLRRQALAAAA